MSTRESIRRTLVYQMKKQGISVQARANHLNVPPQKIDSYLSGKSSPRILMIVSICEFLKISSDYLLGVTDEFGNKIIFDDSTN